MEVINGEQIHPFKDSINLFLPTYPGVPHAVDITLSAPSILDRPKSLIMILESSSMLSYRRFSGCNKEEVNCKAQHQASECTTRLQTRCFQVGGLTCMFWD